MKAVFKTILAAMLLLVCACSQGGGLANVSLGLSAGAKDLTVGAPDLPSVFEYRLSSGSDTGTWTRIQGGQSQTVLNGLKPGYWVFEGRAYSSSNVLLYEGSTGVVLKNDVQNSVTVIMQRTNISSSGTGTLSLSVQTPLCRDRLSETVQIKYRKAGTETYSSKTIAQGTVPSGGSKKTWASNINSLPAGIYEVVVILYNNQKEVLGRTFTADIRSGKTCSVSGTLDGGPNSETYTIELQMAELITLAENENINKVITGLTDSFTGQDIDAVVINKNSKFQLKYCSKNKIESGDKLSTFGIQAELYDSANDPEANVLCSKEFIMITNDCTSLPAEDWFNTEFKSWAELPTVKTLYVNKNLTGDFSISGVVRLTRLIIGSDVTKITGYYAIADTAVLPVLSIPTNVTELETDSISICDGPSNMEIYCSLSSANLEKILKSSSQVVHNNGPLPISSL